MEKQQDKYAVLSKLTPEELNAYYQNTEKIDRKLDHKLAYRTMMNPLRREMLKYIGRNIKTLRDLAGEFGISTDQVKYHIDMLSQSYYVIQGEEGLKATPRGLGFLENTSLE